MKTKVELFNKNHWRNSSDLNKNTYGKIFKPLIASSLAFALGINVATADTPTISYGTIPNAGADGATQILDLDLSWANSGGLFIPQSNGTTITNLRFEFDGRYGTTNNPSGSLNGSQYIITMGSGISSERQPYLLFKSDTGIKINTLSFYLTEGSGSSTATPRTMELDLSGVSKGYALDGNLDILVSETWSVVNGSKFIGSFGGKGVSGNVSLKKENPSTTTDVEASIGTTSLTFLDQAGIKGDLSVKLTAGSQSFVFDQGGIGGKIFVGGSDPMGKDYDWRSVYSYASTSILLGNGKDLALNSNTLELTSGSLTLGYADTAIGSKVITLAQTGTYTGGDLTLKGATKVILTDDLTLSPQTRYSDQGSETQNSMNIGFIFNESDITTNQNNPSKPIVIGSITNTRGNTSFAIQNAQSGVNPFANISSNQSNLNNYYLDGSLIIKNGGISAFWDDELGFVGKLNATLNHTITITGGLNGQNNAWFSSSTFTAPLEKIAFGNAGASHLVFEDNMTITYGITGRDMGNGVSQILFKGNVEVGKISPENPDNPDATVNNNAIEINAGGASPTLEITMAGQTNTIDGGIYADGNAYSGVKTIIIKSVNTSATNTITGEIYANAWGGYKGKNIITLNGSTNTLSSITAYGGINTITLSGTNSNTINGNITSNWGTNTIVFHNSNLERITGNLSASGGGKNIVNALQSLQISGFIRAEGYASNSTNTITLSNGDLTINSTEDYAIQSVNGSTYNNIILDNGTLTINKNILSNYGENFIEVDNLISNTQNSIAFQANGDETHSAKNTIIAHGNATIEGKIIVYNSQATNDFTFNGGTNSIGGGVATLGSGKNIFTLNGGTNSINGGVATLGSGKNIFTLNGGNTTISGSLNGDGNIAQGGNNAIVTREGGSNIFNLNNSTLTITSNIYHRWNATKTEFNVSGDNSTITLANVDVDGSGGEGLIFNFIGSNGTLQIGSTSSGSFTAGTITNGSASNNAKTNISFAQSGTIQGNIKTNRSGSITNITFGNEESQNAGTVAIKGLINTSAGEMNLTIHGGTSTIGKDTNNPSLLGGIATTGGGTNTLTFNGGTHTIGGNINNQAENSGNYSVLSWGSGSNIFNLNGNDTTLILENKIYHRYNANNTGFNILGNNSTIIISGADVDGAGGEGLNFDFEGENGILQIGSTSSGSFTAGTITNGSASNNAKTNISFAQSGTIQGNITTNRSSTTEIVFGSQDTLSSGTHTINGVIYTGSGTTNVHFYGDENSTNTITNANTSIVSGIASIGGTTNVYFYGGNNTIQGNMNNDGGGSGNGSYSILSRSGGTTNIYLNDGANLSTGNVYTRTYSDGYAKFHILGGNSDLTIQNLTSWGEATFNFDNNSDGSNVTFTNGITLNYGGRVNFVMGTSENKAETQQTITVKGNLNTGGNEQGGWKGIQKYTFNGDNFRLILKDANNLQRAITLNNNQHKSITTFSGANNTLDASFNITGGVNEINITNGGSGTITGNMQKTGGTSTISFTGTSSLTLQGSSNTLSSITASGTNTLLLQNLNGAGNVTSALTLNGANTHFTLKDISQSTPSNSASSATLSSITFNAENQTAEFNGGVTTITGITADTNSTLQLSSGTGAEDSPFNDTLVKASGLNNLNLLFTGGTDDQIHHSTLSLTGTNALASVTSQAKNAVIKLDGSTSATDVTINNAITIGNGNSLVFSLDSTGGDVTATASNGITVQNGGVFGVAIGGGTATKSISVAGSGDIDFQEGSTLLIDFQSGATGDVTLGSNGTQQIQIAENRKSIINFRGNNNGASVNGGITIDGGDNTVNFLGDAELSDITFTSGTNTINVRDVGSGNVTGRINLANSDVSGMTNTINLENNATLVVTNNGRAGTFTSSNTDKPSTLNFIGNNATFRGGFSAGGGKAIINVGYSNPLQGLNIADVVKGTIEGTVSDVDVLFNSGKSQLVLKNTGHTFQSLTSNATDGILTLDASSASADVEINGDISIASGTSLTFDLTSGNTYDATATVTGGITVKTGGTLGIAIGGSGGTRNVTMGNGGNIDFQEGSTLRVDFLTDSRGTASLGSGGNGFTIGQGNYSVVNFYENSTATLDGGLILDGGVNTINFYGSATLRDITLTSGDNFINVKADTSGITGTVGVDHVDGVTNTINLENNATLSLINSSNGSAGSGNLTSSGFANTLNFIGDHSTLQGGFGATSATEGTATINIGTSSSSISGVISGNVSYADVAFKTSDGTLTLQGASNTIKSLRGYTPSARSARNTPILNTLTLDSTTQAVKTEILSAVDANSTVGLKFGDGSHAQTFVFSADGNSISGGISFDASNSVENTLAFTNGQSTIGNIALTSQNLTLALGDDQTNNTAEEKITLALESGFSKGVSGSTKISVKGNGNTYGVLKGGDIDISTLSFEATTLSALSIQNTNATFETLEANQEAILTLDALNSESGVNVNLNTINGNQLTADFNAGDENKQAILTLNQDSTLKTITAQSDSAYNILNLSSLTTTTISEVNLDNGARLEVQANGTRLSFDSAIRNAGKLNIHSNEGDLVLNGGENTGTLNIDFNSQAGSTLTLNQTLSNNGKLNFNFNANGTLTSTNSAVIDTLNEGYTAFNLGKADGSSTNIEATILGGLSFHQSSENIFNVYAESATFKSTAGFVFSDGVNMINFEKEGSTLIWKDNASTDQAISTSGGTTQINFKKSATLASDISTSGGNTQIEILEGITATISGDISTTAQTGITSITLGNGSTATISGDISTSGGNTNIIFSNGDGEKALLLSKNSGNHTITNISFAQGASNNNTLNLSNATTAQITQTINLEDDQSLSVTLKNTDLTLSSGMTLLKEETPTEEARALVASTGSATLKVLGDATQTQSSLAGGDVTLTTLSFADSGSAKLTLKNTNTTIQGFNIDAGITDALLCVDSSANSGDSNVIITKTLNRSKLALDFNAGTSHQATLTLNGANNVIKSVSTQSQYDNILALTNGSTTINETIAITNSKALAFDLQKNGVKLILNNGFETKGGSSTFLFNNTTINDEGTLSPVSITLQGNITADGGETHIIIKDKVNGTLSGSLNTNDGQTSITLNNQSTFNFNQRIATYGGETHINFYGSNAKISGNILTDTSGSTIFNFGQNTTPSIIATFSGSLINRGAHHFNINTKEATLRYGTTGLTFNSGENNINFKNNSTLIWQNNSGKSQAIATIGGTTNFNIFDGISATIASSISTDTSKSNAITQIVYENGSQEKSLTLQGTYNIINKIVTKGSNNILALQNGDTRITEQIITGPTTDLIFVLKENANLILENGTNKIQQINIEGTNNTLTLVGGANAAITKVNLNKTGMLLFGFTGDGESNAELDEITVSQGQTLGISLGGSGNKTISGNILFQDHSTLLIDFQDNNHANAQFEGVDTTIRVNQNSIINFHGTNEGTLNGGGITIKGGNNEINFVGSAEMKGVSLVSGSNTFNVYGASIQDDSIVGKISDLDADLGSIINTINIENYGVFLVGNDGGEGSLTTSARNTINFKGIKTKLQGGLITNGGAITTINVANGMDGTITKEIINQNQGITNIVFESDTTPTSSISTLALEGTNNNITSIDAQSAGILRLGKPQSETSTTIDAILGKNLTIETLEESGITNGAILTFNNTQSDATINTLTLNATKNLLNANGTNQTLTITNGVNLKENKSLHIDIANNAILDSDITNSGGTILLTFSNTDTQSGKLRGDITGEIEINVANNSNGSRGIIEGNITVSDGNATIGFAKGENQKILTLQGGQNTLNTIQLEEATTNNTLAFINSSTTITNPIFIAKSQELNFDLGDNAILDLSNGISNTGTSTLNINGENSTFKGTLNTSGGNTTINVANNSNGSRGIIEGNITVSDGNATIGFAKGENQKILTLQGGQNTLNTIQLEEATTNNTLAFINSSTTITNPIFIAKSQELNFDLGDNAILDLSNGISNTGTSTLNINGENSTFKGTLNTSGGNTTINVAENIRHLVLSQPIQTTNDGNTQINFKGSDTKVTLKENAQITSVNNSPNARIDQSNSLERSGNGFSFYYEGRDGNNEFKTLTIGTQDGNGKNGIVGEGLNFVVYATTHKQPTSDAQRSNKTTPVYSDRIIIESANNYDQESKRNKESSHFLGVRFENQDTLDLSSLSYLKNSNDNILLASVANSSGVKFNTQEEIILGFNVAKIEYALDNDGAYTHYYAGAGEYEEIVAAEQAVTATAFTLNYDLYMANLNSLNKRMGDLRENAHSQGVWARIFNGAQTNQQGLGSKNNYTTIQAGYDYAFGFDGANNYLGVALSYALSTSKTSSKAIDSMGDVRSIDGIYSNAIEAALYNSYVSDCGWYNDTIIKFSYLMSSFDIQASGNGIQERTTSNNTENFAITLGNEVGYTFELGENQEWKITPQLETTFGYLNQSDFKQTIQDTTAYLNSIANAVVTLRTRIGSSFGYDFKQFTQNKDFNASVYVGTFYEYDYIDGGEISMDTNAGTHSNTLSDINSDGRVVLNIGTNMSIKDHTRIYFDFEKSFAGKITTDYQINMGVRFSFGENSTYTPILRNIDDNKAPLKVENEEKQEEEKTEAESQEEQKTEETSENKEESQAKEEE